MRIYTQQKISPVAPKSLQDSRTKGLQTLPRNSTLQRRTLNKNEKYMKKMSKTWLWKSWERDKEPGTQYCPHGRGSQHAPTAPALSREEKRTFLSSTLSWISFLEARKKKFKKVTLWEKERLWNVIPEMFCLPETVAWLPLPRVYNCSLLS